jgi:hypothetical protein
VTKREDGTLSCTILFFTPTGRYLGKHRKLMAIIPLLGVEVDPD